MRRFSTGPSAAMAASIRSRRQALQNGFSANEEAETCTSRSQYGHLRIRSIMARSSFSIAPTPPLPTFQTGQGRYWISEYYISVHCVAGKITFCPRGRQEQIPDFSGKPYRTDGESDRPLGTARHHTCATPLLSKPDNSLARKGIICQNVDLFPPACPLAPAAGSVRMGREDRL